MFEKMDLASANRRLHSSNIKTRRRALKIIKEAKRSVGMKKVKKG